MRILDDQFEFFFKEFFIYNFIVDLFYERLNDELARFCAFDQFFCLAFNPFLSVYQLICDLQTFPFLDLPLTHLLLCIPLLLHTFSSLLMLSVFVPETVKYHIFNLPARIVLPNLVQVILSLVTGNHLSNTVCVLFECLNRRVKT